PSNPPEAPGNPCGAAGVCNAQGQCVGCNKASDCPGTDTECQTRTCTNNICGMSFAPSGTVVSNQTPGDCKQNRCNGVGGVVAVPFHSDLPVDGNPCTQDVCIGGNPSNPPASSGTPCNQNGGKVCNGASACVACVVAADCPGSDTECQTRTCINNTCGFAFAPSSKVVSNQTPGDCKENRCNGAGGVVEVPLNSDLPVDGNPCTKDICTNGNPSNPPEEAGKNCGGTNVCNANGQCVGCNQASDCPGVDTECKSRTCNAGTCGEAFAPAGKVVGSQVPGDCKENQCDGAGNIVAVPKDSDLPPDDGNQCTDQACSSGSVQFPPVAEGTPCNQNGGQVCSAQGSCVQCIHGSQCPSGVCSGNVCQNPACDDNVKNGSESDVDCGGTCATKCANGKTCNTNADCQSNNCNGGICAPPPAVSSTSPTNNETAVATTPIAITFNQAMNPATLIAQTSPGACSGSLQVSLDDFATCIAMAGPPAMSSGNTVATLTPAPGLLVNRTYKIRVTTGATAASGVSLASAFTQPNGFSTTSPNLCNGSLVISQVYGGGGNSGATYKNDFVELHNRGTTEIDLSSMSIQYASATGTTWNRLNLSKTIPAGGYFLIQLAGGNNGSDLPAPDLTGSIDMASANGKVALVANQITIPNGVSCPTGPEILDFVGYGTANCFEGGAAVPALSVTLSAQRLQKGCADVNNNNADFVTGAPTPRNSASPAAVCQCLVRNESDAGLEVDFCNVQFPLSLSVTTGTMTPVVYGRIFEAGATEAVGPNNQVRAQLGFGLPSVNPQYGSWTWTNAAYNTQWGNDDEYQASFTAPAPGSYRYAYRFSLDQGVSWTVCDSNGAGSNSGLTFSLGELPVMTVNP
ncbi:MAG: lamin tail domain-containing protein, partial [Myxococcales bacterium]|nr:lamin tail domain-containing protein [Myxococcales bacterium]